MPLILLALSVAFATDGRLTDPVTPTAQALDLLVDPGEPTYTGTARISVDVIEKLDTFQLHAEALDVLSVHVLRGARAISAVATPVGDDRMQITTAKPLKPGPHTIVISFENDFNTDAVGLYAFQHGEHRFVSSQMEADHARKAFPCFDEPSFKIPWQLTVEAPEDVQVITNTPLAEAGESGGWRKLAFQPTPPLPSYLVALAVGPYEGALTELPHGLEGLSGTVPATLWGMPGTAAQTPFLADANARSLAFLEAYFGTPLPYAKLDWIVLPDHPYGAMENPGAITADQALVYVDPATASTGAVAQAATTVAHEVGHMWFGDLVTMAWWDDFWLNEAFASWISHKAVARLWPQTESVFTRSYERTVALQQDGLATSRPLRTEVDPSHVFETSNTGMMYSKAPALLSMVEAWIGPEAFREGVRSYLKANAGGNATSKDLFQALGAASGQDVQGLLQPYLDRPGAPLVDLTPGDGGAQVTLSRYARFGSSTPTEGAWQVPVTLKFRDASGVHETRTVLTASGPIGFGDGKVAWVYPTVGTHGYFAWSQPGDAMKALLADAQDALTPEERHALLLNLGLLAGSGRVQKGQQLEWLATLEGETHAEVISEMLAVTSTLEDLVDEPHEAGLAAYLRDTYGPALQALGTEPRDTDTPREADLRVQLMQTLSRLGQDEALQELGVALGRALLADPEPTPTPLQTWGLVQLAKTGDAALFDTLKARLDATQDVRLRQGYLAAMGHVPGQEERALALALGQGLGFFERLNLVQSLFREPEDRARAFAWAKAHHKELTALFPEPRRAYMAYFAAGCDAEVWAQGKEFYGAPERALPGVERVIAELDDTVATCVAQKELHRDSVLAFLDAYASPE